MDISSDQNNINPDHNIYFVARETVHKKESVSIYYFNTNIIKGAATTHTTQHHKRANKNREEKERKKRSTNIDNRKQHQ